MAGLSSIIRRKYSNFRGVDFTGGVVSPYRSPDALNMWKDYKDDDCIQTRPGMTLLGNFNGEIFGLFFLKKNNVLHTLVHCGTKLLEWTNFPNKPVRTTELFTQLNPKQSKSFIFNDTLFIMDGIYYLEYDGTTVKQVEGTIPYTSYYRNPDGSTSIDEDTDIDLVNQPVNVLQPKRKNLFIADGLSKKFVLDTQNLDSSAVFLMTGLVDGVPITENIDFTVNRTKGFVAFNNLIAKGSKVEITLSKTTSGYKQRILNSTLMCEFDNRIFFSGNPDYPNTVFHSELNDPRYIRDTAYYECGLSLANIKAIIPGNNVLWVLKDIEQNGSSLYYMTPTLDSRFNKIYPSVSGSINVGCVSEGINFNDDIVFFSKNGMEGISSSTMYSEQILQHRSSLIDAKLLNEPNYSKIKITEFNGYLMVLTNSHIYLADSRKRSVDEAQNVEYDWFYWELPKNITFMKEYREVLYLGNANGELFTLSGETDAELDIESYWTTQKDDFNSQAYTKTTNKRGNVANVKVMNNDNILLSTIVDGKLKEKKIYSDAKGYIAYRIKDKKFKDIQLKFSSNKRFGLFSCTLEGFIAGYIKR